MWLSKCCRAGTYVNSGGEGTAYYGCKICGKATDIVNSEETNLMLNALANALPKAIQKANEEQRKIMTNTWEERLMEKTRFDVLTTHPGGGWIPFEDAKSFIREELKMHDAEWEKAIQERDATRHMD